MVNFTNTTTIDTHLCSEIPVPVVVAILTVCSHAVLAHAYKNDCFCDKRDKGAVNIIK